METIGSYWWVALLAVVVLLILLYRHGGFRVGVKGPVGELEVEGRGQGTTAVAPKSDKPVAPSVQSTGARSVAIGGSAAGAHINIGDQSTRR